MTRLVHWYEGMFMRVQSLQMLQQGLLERIEGVRRLQHHYPYGVTEAELASDALAGGKIRFSRLRAVLPNGLEVIVPEECDLPELPVREAIAQSRLGEVTVLLAVPDYSPNGQNVFRLGEPPNPQVNFRYIPSDDENAKRGDENTGDNPQTIIVRKLNARLIFQHEPKAGLDSIPLLKVRKASAGGSKEFRVELVPGFVPPCLYLPPPELSAAPERAGGKPGARLADLSLPQRLAEEIYLSVKQVESARRRLAARMQDQHLGMGALQGTQFQKWMRLLALSRQAARLLVLQQSPRTTPFEMYLALFETLLELEASQPRLAASTRSVQEGALQYNHEDAFAVFSRLRNRLEKALNYDDSVEYYEAVFERVTTGQNRVRAALRPEFFGSNIAAWYLALQTPLTLNRMVEVIENRRDFELTTPDRIGQGYGGLQLSHKRIPPPGLPDAPDLYYFTVELSNDPLLKELWDAVKASCELAVSLSNPHLDLNDAAFKFYAILQPKALDATTYAE